jgi:hypothetical protein
MADVLAADEDDDETADSQSFPVPAAKTAHARGEPTPLLT